MEVLKRSVKLEITAETPRVKYQKRAWETKREIIHWGQRKLLMTEIMFLTRWGDLSDRVVYAGAAPGHHLRYLSHLFPRHQFTLIDPNPFGIEETDRIKIINGYFDDALAERYSGQHVLFISDIRTADHRQMSLLENEQRIVKDNEAQMRWITMMRPARSMIKFRCPYPDVIKTPTQMFRGCVYIQPWAPPSSTETRLVIDPELKVVAYDNQRYEEQLFYHNTVARFANYPQPVRGEGLDNRYDSSVEVIIMCDYLTKFSEYLKGRAVYKAISDMSYEISRSITESERTLRTPMKEPDKRRQFPRVDHRGGT